MERALPSLTPPVRIEMYARDLLLQGMSSGNVLELRALDFGEFLDASPARKSTTEQLTRIRVEELTTL